MALQVSKGPKKIQALKKILEAVKFDDDIHKVSPPIFITISYL
jgi:hypothetical protein